MSYCRWSSMNWMCDLYCYEDAGGGWTTHVAASRRSREPVSEDKAWTDFMADRITAKEVTEAHKATMADLETIPLEPIGLAHDGEDFNDPTLEAFRDRVVTLAETGYVVPDWLVPNIEEEIEDQANANT